MSTSHASLASSVSRQFLRLSWFFMTLLAWHPLCSALEMHVPGPGLHAAAGVGMGLGNLSKLVQAPLAQAHTVGRVAGIFGH